MRSDSRSVAKGPILHVRARELLPRKCAKLVFFRIFLPQNTSGFFFEISLSVEQFPASPRAQRKGITASTIGIRLGQIRDPDYLKSKPVLCVPDVLVVVSIVIFACKLYLIPGI